MADDTTRGLIKANWEHFIASVIFAVLFPLLPLVIEACLGEKLTDSSVLIGAIMYCSALSVVSNSVSTFGFGFVVSIILAMLFGITFYNGSAAPGYGREVAMLCIAGFGLAHIFQRYNQHVVLGQDFISFRSAK